MHWSTRAFGGVCITPATQIAQAVVSDHSREATSGFWRRLVQVAERHRRIDDR